MPEPAKAILIIGASRGLGLGLADAFADRGWHVIATTRGASAGLAALAEARSVDVEQLDIDEGHQAATLRTKLDGRRLHAVFVNAGVMDAREPIGAVSTVEFTRLLVTNAFSPLRMIETFAPLVVPEGVLGVMSSGLGSVANNTSGGYEVYRASKAALNMLLRSYATRDPGRAVVAMSPGWVRTDMGGPDASLDVETSARGMADVIASRLGHPGCAFLNYQGKPVAW